MGTGEHLDLVRTYFNANSNDWHDYYHTVKTVNSLVLMDRTNIAVNFIDKHLKPTSRILDAGCGAGVASMQLLRKGFFVHGMDVAESMLALCEEKFMRTGIDRSRYTSTLGNVLESALPAQSFDGIIALGFLQYQGDEEKALAAFYDLLRPGGVLILSGPSRVKISNWFGVPDAIKAKLRSQRRNSRVQSNDPNIQLLLRVSVNTYTVARLKELVEGAGLRLLEFRGHGYVDFKIIGRWLNFRRELFLHRALTRIARFVPIERFANDLVVAARKNLC